MCSTSLDVASASNQQKHVANVVRRYIFAY